MRRHPLLRDVAALAAALWPATQAAAQPPAFGPPSDYRLVWADEFDKPGLPDPAKWNFDTVRNKEGWHNEELQYYSHPDVRNAVVRDGRLVITARRESPTQASDYGGQRYTSARLHTKGKGEWTYGFVEVRARMPCGKGTWPAIWMLGTGGRWPEDGELDILEHMGKDPTRVFSTVHTAAGHGGKVVSGAQRITTACSRFHRYQMHWTPEAVTYAVDGFVHLHYPKLDGAPASWPFDGAQFLLLNLAIGGVLGGPVDDRIFPVRFEIDYVRVWQKG